MAGSSSHPDGLRIRPPIASEVHVLAEFNCLMAVETEGLILDPTLVTAGVAGLIADPRHGFYRVAELDGKVVGQLCVTYEWSDWRNGVYWWIQSVFVAKPHRGKGVFTALFDSVKHSALETPGVRGLRLYAFSENSGAIEVYQRLGMAKTHYIVFESLWPADEASGK